jgi:CMP-N-acetylneuraminic acid synthetase
MANAIPRIACVPTLAVIPARAGSRGLPGKHLRLIGGEPMLKHTVRAALTARRVDRVVVTTNDPAVARLARRAGVDVIDRPAALATEGASTVSAVRHALRAAEAVGTRYDVIVTLQPTSPLRHAAQIDAAIAALDAPDIDSAVSVAALKLPASVIGWLADGRLRRASGAPVGQRQASPPAVRISGGIYVTRRSLLDRGRLLGAAPAAVLVDAASAVDVDDADDLAEARRQWRRRR